MSIHGGAGQAVVLPRAADDGLEAVALPAALCLRVLRQATEIHAAGLKSYGLLVAEPGTPGYPFTATGVVFFDPWKNRRRTQARPR